MQTAKNTLLIRSSTENIILIEKFINDIADVFDLTKDIRDNILLALTEAFNNAIRHGNCLDSKKNVALSFKVKGDKLVFMVKDQGAGFDYSDLPDPTDPGNIEKISGRGIFLMRRLSDNLSFEDNGSKVILEFTLQKRTLFLGPDEE